MPLSEYSVSDVVPSDYKSGLKIAFVWDVTLYNLVERYRHFGGTFCISI
jgi:hypothetical protein